MRASIWLADRVPSSPARYDVRSKPVLISVLSEVPLMLVWPIDPEVVTTALVSASPVLET